MQATHTQGNRADDLDLFLNRTPFGFIAKTVAYGI